MLTSAADYHFQPTDGCDVTNVPSFLRSDSDDCPLRFGDLLYLMEAYLAAWAGMRFQSSSSGALLGTEGNRPLSDVLGLLDMIDGFNQQEYSTAVVVPWLIKPDSSTAARSYSGSSYLIECPGVKNGLLDMSAYKYTQPQRWEKFLDLSHLRRAWSAVANTRRVITNGRGRITKAGSSICGYLRTTDSDGNEAEEFTDADATFAVNGFDWLPTMTINGAFVGLSIASDGGENYWQWDYRPIGVTAHAPTFPFAYSGRACKDVGRGYFGDSLKSVMGTVEFFDVTINYKHLQ